MTSPLPAMYNRNCGTCPFEGDSRVTPLRKAIVAVLTGALLSSCGGPGAEREPQALTSREIDAIVKERHERAKRILKARRTGAKPALDLDKLKYNENPQGESSPYPGREANTERLDELKTAEIIRRFGLAYRRIARVTKRGRPYDWKKLEVGGSPADELDRCAAAMLRREETLGFKRGKVFTKNVVLLRRNAHRVWRDALQNADDLLERDLEHLKTCCSYFPKEIAEGLLGVGVRLEEDLVAEGAGEAPAAPSEDAAAEPEGSEAEPEAAGEGATEGEPPAEKP